MAKFTHLHVHSEYSLLDGLAKIESLFAKALELGMDSLALTDHGVMYGAIKFYLAAKEFEMKPIIGLEAYMAARSRFDKQANIDSDRYHLILLAKNETGYTNLMKLTTLANLEGFYYKPRIDMELLKKYQEGLIASSACLDGEIPQLLLKKRDKEAEQKAKAFLEIFGDNFYLEIQHHPKIPEQKEVNQKIVKLSRKLGIPLVATNDVHYVEADDAEAQDALLAVQTQKMIKDKNRLTMLRSPDLYLRSQEEMIEAFKDYPEAIKNTRKITQACNLEIPIGRWILPNYPLLEGKTAEEHLKELTFERLKDRYEKPEKEVLERINYELEVICKKGFATYFLIVQDFVNWAKQQKIRVGHGRGSAAGSLVSYILRITSVNPLKHNIPFERFLNPERISPPDIDLDFADDRRDEVIEYVTQKYGKDKVAQIITFNIMRAKESVRDIGRVLGMPYSDPDKIAKLIPMGLTITQALKAVPELANYYRQPEYKKLLDLAQKVEGVSRHASTHAAGLVIADKNLTEYVPLQKETKGERIITQYDMYSLDLNVSEKAIGLLKIDLLGLRNLTILEKALDYIRHIGGEEIDLSEIPLDDQAALKVIASGETTGIFQLESNGMRRLARKLRPNKFSDISAMVALYRPGPMQFIDEFIAGKENFQKIHYLHPDLKPILEETYGIAVYQEQCLQITNVIAGYTLGEAEIFRRAIGKKKKGMMTRERNKFIKKAMEKGYKKEIVENIFGLIERFAGYGFNKAHSTCYAMIAYQTAYLKVHWPVEFMAALLTAEASGTSGPAHEEKVSLAIEECARMKIKVLPPDINQSKIGFTIEEGATSLEGKAIRFGFSAIKNVGEVAIKAILAAREVGGDFKSIYDFCQRVDQQKVNKKVLESLIRVGAMEMFGKRAALLSSLEKIRSKGTQMQKEKANGQAGLFDNDPPADSLEEAGPDMEEFSRQELLSLEKELLGFYLTDHPLNQYLPVLAAKCSHRINDLLQDSEKKKDKLVSVGGMITSLRLVLTKANAQEMAFAKIEDDSGSIEAVVFPKIYSRTKECWVKNQMVLVKGRVQIREESPNLVVDEARLLEKEQDKETQEEKIINWDFEVTLPSQLSPRKLVELNKLLKQKQGKNKLALAFVDNSGRVKRLVLPFGVDYSEELEKEMKKIIEE
ncbi:DNA polymerase III subunit alpha [Patescibacteria group bacterium]|nr:DNA polymerase III subunit alpha [Patescibacteria group bacterium]